ncbi:MAG: hypothetical protein ABR596_02600 [Halarsenatibacteraceae bacterium]
MSRKIGFRIKDSDDFTVEKLDEKAESLGLNRSELISTALDMIIKFDNEFIKKMQKRAEGLNMPLGYVIQNMIIKRLAEEAAETEVDQELGREYSQRALMEFQSKRVGNSYKPITGEELFNDLKARKKKRLIQVEVQDLLEKRRRLSKDLPEHEQEFLKKYHRSSSAGQVKDDQEQIDIAGEEETGWGE